jgi:hypothetical protein
LFILLSLLTIGGVHAAFANDKDLEMDPSKISASVFWASNEEIDAYIDGIKATISSQVDQAVQAQTLQSLEEYRERLKRSLITGEPIAILRWNGLLLMIQRGSELN